jgi:hypothetical protein
VLGSLLVDVSRLVMLLLVDLVADGILGGRGPNVRGQYRVNEVCVVGERSNSPSAEGGIAVLGNVLVGLLGAGAGST